MVLNMKATKKFLDFLDHTEFEIRLIKKDSKTGESIVLSKHGNKADIISYLEDYSGEYNCYVGLNERTHKGTKNKDVIALSNIGIDIDAGANHKDKPATDEELSAALEVAYKIAEGIERNTGAKPFMTASGNGYQLVYSLPKLTLEEDREVVNTKINNFIEVIKQKYDNNIVTIDKTGDLARVFRIPGTINLKGDKEVKILEENPRIENNTLLQAILSQETVKTDVVGKIDFDLTPYWETDPKAKQLFDGNIEGFESRSEAESSLVFRLVQMGLTKEQVFKVMASSKTAKWNEVSMKYRETTYNKAVASITQPKELKEAPINDYRVQKIETWQFGDFQKLKKDKDYLIEGVAYRKTANMFFSPPAQYKSLLCLDMALCLANGKDWLGNHTKKKRRVLYCDKENNDQIIRSRLLALHKGHNLNKKKFPLHILRRNGDLLNSDFVAALDSYIKENKIEIVFFDTLHRFADYDENKSDDLNRLYTMVFQPLIEKYGISIFFLHHTKKDGGYRGSGDFLGMVDTAWSVRREGKTSKFVIVNEKSRSGEIENISGEIEFCKDTTGEDLEYIKILRLNETKEKEDHTSKLKVVTNLLKDYIKHGVEYKRKDFLDFIELANLGFVTTEDSITKLVTRALKFLVDNDYLDKTEKGVYTRLLK